MSRRLYSLVGAATLVLIVGWWRVVVDGITTDGDTAPALLTWIVLGLIAIALTGHRRRPGDPIWTLVATMAVTTPLGYFSALSSPVLAAVGAFVWLAMPLVPAQLLLGYPEGLRSHRRLVVVSCWIVPALLAATTVAVSAPRRSSGVVSEAGVRALFWIHGISGTDGYVRQGNPFLIHASVSSARLLWLLWSVWIVTVTVLTALTLWRRLRRADRATRRLIAAVYATGMVWCAAQLTRPLLAFPGKLPGGGQNSVLFGHWYTALVQLALPIALAALVAGLGWAQLLRPRLSRSTEGALRVDGREGTSIGRLRRSLTRILADPTVRVVFRLPSGAWVDEAGRAAELAAAPDRAAMIVQRGEQTVAAIEHDASLLAQAELVEVAATMVGFALDNERLHAEILARVEETRASGARLLGAADQAHEAFELRVLNGPDATLARVAALLAPRVGSPDVMEEVYAGLRSAVAQVRSIAHGLYPLSLIEHGLAAALDDLSGRVDVQLRVRGVPARRLPATIEITCYLAVAGAATRARDRLVVEFDLEAELVCRIEGAEGPPDELVVDRTGAVGGTIEARGDCIVLRLPLPAMLARA